MARFNDAPIIRLTGWDVDVHPFSCRRKLPRIPLCAALRYTWQVAGNGERNRLCTVSLHMYSLSGHLEKYTFRKDEQMQTRCGRDDQNLTSCGMSNFEL